MSSNHTVKPMSIAHRDFVDALTNLINSSMLPPFVIEDVLKDTLNKVSIVSKKQLEDDIRKYEKASSNIDDHTP